MPIEYRGFQGKCHSLAATQAPSLQISAWIVSGSSGGDFQGRCHSLAASQAAWTKGSARIGSGSSGGLLIHTSSGWRQQRVLRLQRVGLAWRAAS